MPKRAYNFLPDTLIEYADSIADYLESHGYRVITNKTLPASPRGPTFYARRYRTEMAVLVVSAIEIDLLKNWCAYAKSTGRDFRVCCMACDDAALNHGNQEFVREEGIGLFSRLNKEVVEEVSPKDLGLVAALPTLESLTAKERQHLGPAYEQFNRSQWREGFEDACQALENRARSYLLGEVGTRVTQFIRAQGPVAASKKEVKRMTLGQLAKAFGEIPNQTQTDAQIAQILTRINKDRVRVVHYKNHSDTERRLRKNVGMHMWSIVSGIRILC